MSTDRKSQAMEIVRNMLAPETAAMMDSSRPAADFCQDFGEIGFTNVFETLWTRPGLPLRERSMITVAILIALRATNEMAIHFPAAIRNGVTVAEIEEIIMHAAGYAGFPAAATARDIAYESLKKANLLD